MPAPGVIAPSAVVGFVGGEGAGEVRGAEGDDTVPGAFSDEGVAEAFEGAVEGVHEAGVAPGGISTGYLGGVGVESAELDEEDLAVVAQCGPTRDEPGDQFHLIGKGVVHRDAGFGTGEGVVKMDVERTGAACRRRGKGSPDHALGESGVVHDTVVGILHEAVVRVAHDAFEGPQAVAGVVALVVSVLKK